MLHHQNGQLGQAEAIYQQILQIDPNNADAFHFLGLIAAQTGRNGVAIKLIGKAISLNSREPGFYFNLGKVFQARRDLEKAVQCYRDALALKPDFADAKVNLGNVLAEQGTFEEAATCFRQVLVLIPDDAEVHYNLGMALVEQDKLEEAVACFRQALKFKSNFPEAIDSLGSIYLVQGNAEEAMICYRRAIAHNPGFLIALQNLLFSMNYHSQYSPAQRLAEACSYGRKVMAQTKPYTRWQFSPTDKAPLRVGLVSGDLRTHPVGYFMESLLAHLNTARVELVGYSTNQWESELTTRIKPHFAAWHTIAGLSDEAAAQMIHKDGIHILIDLAGHTGGNRLPVFAWKPAPVQVSWLGYFATTGVPGMDYLLADPVSVPECHREHFTETVWYLPDTRLCFTPPTASARLVPTPPPAIRNGFITFGCFQNLTKVNDGVLAVWGEIFHALPQARLRLQSKHVNCPVAREHLQKRLARVGIMPEKVVLEGSVPREEYLAGYANVDIILDTFPYPGGATTCEALWMGVPTLTLAGNSMLARQGASLLACVGLEDWIASDEADYAARTIAYATDINRLAQLRSTLRSCLLVSPLCDAPLFARNLEAAFRGMWEAYGTQGVGRV